MSVSKKILACKILRLLRNAASYNDKGCVWSGHNEEQQKIFLAELQKELLNSCSEIGWENLGAELENAVKCGSAVCDFSGNIVFLAEKQFRARYGI